MAEESTAPASLLRLVHEEDQSYVLDRLAHVLSRKVLTLLEFRVQLPKRQEQWVCVKASAIEGAAGNLVIGHVEDVTLQRVYNDHLKRYSNKKNSVLNILAHDLAGPLGMIQNLSELLAEQLNAHEEEETQEVLRLIERMSKHGSELLREFMNQEFLESSHTELITRRVNMVAKMGEALEEYKIVGGELMTKTVSFTSSSDEVYAELDDLKFMQVITNLISNALKFTADDGIINVRLEEEENSVLVTVADNGVGIPAKYHPILFEKFTEARRPGLKGEKSVGLGMSIVKTIIEWHHGEIWFESAEGQGTTFYIRIPKKQNKLGPAI